VRLRTVSEQTQIRKVQRRDRKGGGESSSRMLRGRTGSEFTKSVAEVSAAANSSFTVVFESCVLDSGIGACDRAQQELPREVMVGAVCSPIPILSHCDCVSGVTQSVVLDDKIAQAESCTGPSPTMLNAKPKLNNRRRVTPILPDPSRRSRIKATGTLGNAL